MCQVRQVWPESLLQLMASELAPLNASDVAQWQSIDDDEVRPANKAEINISITPLTCHDTRARYTIQQGWLHGTDHSMRELKYRINSPSSALGAIVTQLALSSCGKQERQYYTLLIVSVISFMIARRGKRETRSAIQNGSPRMSCSVKHYAQSRLVRA